MGWTTTRRDPGQSVKDFLREQVNCENKSGRWFVLDLAIVSLRTAYMAVEIVKRNQETGELDLSTKRVVAFVFLLQYWPKDEHNIGYKDMDETMGPCEAECPAKILDLLTELLPTEEYAAAWRAKCREHIADRKLLKLKVGQEIYTDPIMFSDGREREHFHVTSLKPLRFRSYDDNTSIRLSRRALMRALKKEKSQCQAQ